jgi:N-acetylglucosamine kinase-like BadF-type ATPase
VLKAWDLAEQNQIVEMANRTPAPDFSRLTEQVLGCAEEGDSVANEVLRREGEELALLVCLVIRRLKHAANYRSWTPELAFAGSIMDRVMPVRHALIEAVRREFPEVKTLDGVVDPVLGALWRARRGLQQE